MAAMIPTAQTREIREGEKWYYEFCAFMKEKYPEVYQKLTYHGFRFFDDGDYRHPLLTGGVFQIVGDQSIPEEMVQTLAAYSSPKIVSILYQREVKQYGKNCIVVLLR